MYLRIVTAIRRRIHLERVKKVGRFGDEFNGRN